VIAFSGQQAFGSAQLIAHDMDTRMELTPWLAGVYTAAEYRGRGIGIGLDRTDYRRSTGAGCQQVISLHAQSRDILFKAWMDDD
jgi:predicted N-acetyltransferase YhbS